MDKGALEQNTVSMPTSSVLMRTVVKENTNRLIKAAKARLVVHAEPVNPNYYLYQRIASSK
jgi:hypothetical protein